MTELEEPSLTISLRKGDTPAPACSDLADYLYGYFMTPAFPGHRYGRYQHACSIIALPETFEAYFEGPAGYGTRRKVRRAEREGYTFRQIEPDAWRDDILAVNTSLGERQGRPMDEAYRTEATPGRDLAVGCPRHREVWYGIVRDDRLVAYTWVYQVGEMCLFNRILGHGDHMASGVMYQLITGALQDLIPSAGLRYAMYERHTSGTPGLRFFKEQMGFAPYWVDWQLADEPVVSKRPLFEEAQRRAAEGRPGLPRRVVRRIRREISSRLGG